MSPPLQSKRKKLPYWSEAIKAKVKEKSEFYFNKSYNKNADIQMVEQIMCIFDVEKGDNIYMVYDWLKSGLNDLLWAPWFALPTIDTMTRLTLAWTWLTDNNYGDIFLNFPMHKDL